jgi:hypothetical protein
MERRRHRLRRHARPSSACGTEGLKEREGKERGEKGGGEGERNLDPDVPDRSTPLPHIHNQD